MRLRHVIYLSGGGAALYTRDRAGFAPVASYDLAGGGGQALVASLHAAPGVVAIIVDALEEEHHRDTLPRLGRRDQAAMLARKLGRTFPRTSYRTATVQDRLPDDPGTQRILLSGLPKADQLAGLQALLAEARVPVAAVCSPALLSRPLVEKLRPPNPADASLVVSRQRDGGLRVSYFRGRHLAGSRLMRPSLAAPPGDFPRLTRQLEESVRYFDAAFAPGAANPVDVLLLCEPVVTGPDGTAGGHEGFRIHAIESGTAAQRLGIRAGLEPGNGNLLFVELLGRYAPAGNYAPPDERRYFQLDQLRSAGRNACLGLTAAALAGTAINVAGLLDIRRDTATIRSAIGDVTSQLEAEPGADGPGGTDPLEMQRIGTAWQLLRQHAVEPEEILGLLSRALEANPQVRLEGIAWQHINAAAPATDGEESPDPVETDPDAAEANGSAPASGEQRIRLTVRGRVEPFDGNYPLAFLDVRTFMSSLGADPRVLSVKARREPLDVSPRSSLTGEMTPGTRVDAASFTLNVLLRFEHEPA